MVQAWWWYRWFENMTGGKGGAGGRKKMDKGGGTPEEEKPSPISTILTADPATIGAQLEPTGTDKTTMPLDNSVDFFTQASKALTLRSPFDYDEMIHTSTSGASGKASGGFSTFLPGAWAQFMAKHSDSRSKHKKSHSGAEHKNKKRVEKSRGSTFWDAMEECFRELTLDDVDRLHRSSLGFATSDKCFRIPSCNVNRNARYPDTVGRECYMCRMGDSVKLDSADAVHGDSLNDTVLKAEEMTEENEQDHMDMDVDIVGGVNEEYKEIIGHVAGMDPAREKGPPASSLEWLLGSRNKVYLTTERPSKKRKLLGGDAGLEKIMIPHPVEESASLCHYCSIGDFVGESNRLVTCTSCGMAVHQICYGVQSDFDENWLCSWCKHKGDERNVERPCLLCPKGGGALKPSQNRENAVRFVNYAHLFCCQWMPEAYVENTKTMEPILNIDRINDTRKKLICCLCKVKYGACVRCSNGSCRTSFHPICAREAGHRMEIWGRLGCDEVELRAFCSKHSEIHAGNQSSVEPLVLASSDLKLQHVTESVNKLNNLKDVTREGDKSTLQVDAANLKFGMDKLNNGVFCGDGLMIINKSNLEVQPECVDVQQPMTNCAAEKETVDADRPCNQICFDTLEQLIVQGKIDLKDVAADCGVSVEALAPVLLDNHMAPNLRFKLVEWLRNHGYNGNLLETLDVKFKSNVPEKSEACNGDADSNVVIATVSGNGSLIPVKGLPPRRTKNDLRFLKIDEGMSPTNEVCNGDMLIEEAKNRLASEESFSSKESPDGIEKNFSKATACHEILANNSFEAEGEQITYSDVCISNNGHSNEAAKPENIIRPNMDVPNSVADPPSNQMPDHFKLESCNSFIHPLLRHKLIGMDVGQEYDGNIFSAFHPTLIRPGGHLSDFACSGDRKISHFGTSSSSGSCCSQHNQQHSNDLISKIYGSKLEQLVNAKNMGLLALSPTSEVEGELIFYQYRLLSIANTRKRLIDGLTSRVSENLQQEIDFSRRNQWDAVLLSQYLHDLREAKKQGRKERRHKEAQAILAAATAAVASSTRNSSLRKDSLCESAPVEDTSSLRTSNGRAGTYSHQNSRVKETPSRSAATRLSPDKQFGPLYLSSDPSAEHSRMCDICQRWETNLNPILVCSNCKVAVHLDCYRNVRKSSGPWYCELCEELMVSRGSGTITSNSWEKLFFVAECGLCSGTAGAFRKSIDGQWIHAFCAEWVLESKITRGQVHPIEGMLGDEFQGALSKGGDACGICGRRQGVCIKCNYGNCQSTFHPSCARSTGFYMNVRSIGGKLQHKAYCGKHSMEQRTKAEKHGVEEFNRLRQVRVELERLRLLCERIIKREKLKRELVLCSHDVISSKRDNAVFSALSNHHLCHGDVSSESATTSTRGYTDGNNGGDTVQRSDDLTVDSKVAGKRRVKILSAIDSDQKTDDSSVSQHMTPIPAERGSLSGKYIPSRPPVGSHIALDGEEKRSTSKKQTETFEKEIIMTSDQASMKNQRLPKGFVYVPIGCLAKEKESAPGAFSEER